MTEPTTPPPGQPAWTPPGGESPTGWTAPASTPPPTGAAAPATPSNTWQQGWDRPHHREGRSGAIIGGLILVSLGAIFLVDEFVPGFDIGRLWPLILVAIGAALLVGAFLRRT